MQLDRPAYATGQTSSPITVQRVSCPRAEMLAHTMTNILRQQEQEIREVIDTIHENIDHQRSDLRFCLPELREVGIGLLQECSDTDHLANELGVGHDTVLYWDLRLDRLFGEANEAIRFSGFILRLFEDEDWYSDQTEPADTRQHMTEVPAVSPPHTMQPRTEVPSVSKPDTKQAWTGFPNVSQPRFTAVQSCGTDVLTVSQLDTMQPGTVFPTVSQLDTRQHRESCHTTQATDDRPEATQEEPGKQRAEAASGLGAIADTTQPITQVQVSNMQTKDAAAHIRYYDRRRHQA